MLDWGKGGQAWNKTWAFLKRLLFCLTLRESWSTNFCCLGTLNLFNILFPTRYFLSHYHFDRLDARWMWLDKLEVPLFKPWHKTLISMSIIYPHCKPFLLNLEPDLAIYCEAFCSWYLYRHNLAKPTYTHFSVEKGSFCSFNTSKIKHLTCPTAKSSVYGRLSI